MLTGAAIVFFTYIGFDSVSTAAEECRNPQRDMAFGIIATLVVCAALYIAVALVLTGLVNWKSLNSAAAPVADALKSLGKANRHLRGWVNVGALVGMISSLMVFQYGQARIWFAMSRDGLLPKAFSEGAQKISHSARQHMDSRSGGRHSGWHLGHRYLRRFVEHRDAVRIYRRLGGRAGAACKTQPERPGRVVSRALVSTAADPLDCVLSGADAGAAARNLAAVFRVARDRAGDLLPVRPPPQRSAGRGEAA